MKKKVKLSLNDVVLLYEELNGRYDSMGNLLMKGLRLCGPISGVGKLKLTRLSNLIKQEHDNYREVNMSIIKEMGELKDDRYYLSRFELDADGNQTDVETENWKYYQSTIQDMLKTELDFEIELIEEDMIKDIVIPEDCDYPIFFRLID